jgi:hypothetical protein
MTANTNAVCVSGCLYGADDFLPMLTYVLAQCDMPQLDNEILYMMEVLDPSLLHGEGTAHICFTCISFLPKLYL